MYIAHTCVPVCAESCAHTSESCHFKGRMKAFMTTRVIVHGAVKSWTRSVCPASGRRIDTLWLCWVQMPISLVAFCQPWPFMNLLVCKIGIISEKLATLGLYSLFGLCEIPVVQEMGKGWDSLGGRGGVRGKQVGGHRWSEEPKEAKVPAGLGVCGCFARCAIRFKSDRLAWLLKTRGKLRNLC